MRVVSWNIRHGGGKSVDRILDQLQVWNPDIVGLQEFRGTAPSQKMAQTLRDRGLIHQASTVDPIEPRWNRLLLASRYPFTRQPSEGILADTGQWLHVTLEPPMNLHLMVMRIPNRDEGNKFGFHAEVVDVFKSLNSEDALAFGDTNTGVPQVDESAMYFLEREGEWFDHIRSVGWQDVWRARNPDTREYTWFSQGGSGFRLDQLFATSSAEPKVTTVDYEWGENEQPNDRRISDHAAIVVDIDIETPPAT